MAVRLSALHTHHTLLLRGGTVRITEIDDNWVKCVDISVQEMLINENHELGTGLFVHKIFMS
jgi:hypothetical protein